jgi:hypothetical protein
MKIRGVCYDVGRVIMGQNQRPDFDIHLIGHELSVMKDSLHCNAVRICGESIDRLRLAAEEALRRDLEVWLSPELFGRGPDETLQYLAEAAAAAEELRRQWPGRVVLSVGSELTLFMNGILASDNILDQLSSPLSLAWTMLRLRVGRSNNRRLNAFLKKATTTVRPVFQGPLTYASTPIESVDWKLFDIIGLDYYRAKRNRARYGENLARYRRFGKPIVITEVGFCTYQGAEDRGGQAFMIADPKNPERVDSSYIRDERLQAKELTDVLAVINGSAADGAFVFTFVTPTLPHHEDPARDFDKGSFALVKSHEGPTGEPPYPDTPWEVKEAFDAVGKAYAAMAE